MSISSNFLYYYCYGPATQGHSPFFVPHVLFSCSWNPSGEGSKPTPRTSYSGEVVLMQWEGVKSPEPPGKSNTACNRKCSVMLKMHQIRFSPGLPRTISGSSRRSCRLHSRLGGGIWLWRKIPPPHSPPCRRLRRLVLGTYASP